MNVPMTRTIEILYPERAKTMLEGTYKKISAAGQTYRATLVRGQLKTINDVKKEKLFAMLDEDKKLTRISEKILANTLDVSKTTVNRWKIQHKKLKLEEKKSNNND